MIIIIRRRSENCNCLIRYPVSADPCTRRQSPIANHITFHFARAAENSKSKHSVTQFLLVTVTRYFTWARTRYSFHPCGMCISKLFQEQLTPYSLTFARLLSIPLVTFDRTSIRRLWNSGNMSCELMSLLRYFTRCCHSLLVTFYQAIAFAFSNKSNPQTQYFHSLA